MEDDGGGGIRKESCSGEDTERDFCCEDFGRSSCFGEDIGEGSGSGCIMAEGERNEKSGGKLESPFRVYSIVSQTDIYLKKLTYRHCTDNFQCNLYPTASQCDWIRRQEWMLEIMMGNCIGSKETT